MPPRISGLGKVTFLPRGRGSPVSTRRRELQFDVHAHRQSQLRGPPTLHLDPRPSHPHRHLGATGARSTPVPRLPGPARHVHRGLRAVASEAWLTLIESEREPILS